MGKVLTVTLNDETAERLDARLASGEYGSLADVVDAALEALAARSAAGSVRLCETEAPSA